MSTSWDTMTDREQDAHVCERIFGWERHDLILADAPPDGVMTIDVGAPHYWTTPDGKNRYLRTPWPLSKDQEVPRYTTDYNACRLVEDEIARHDLIAAYIEALLRITVGHYDPYEIGLTDLICILQAESDQRCQAAIRVLAGEGDTAKQLPHGE